MRTLPIRPSGPVLVLFVLLLLVSACSDGVTDPEPGNEVTGVTLSVDANPVPLPSTAQVSATVAPAGAPQGVTWSSSDPDVATVSASGLVTTRLRGTTTITATSTANTAVSGSLVLNTECPEPRRVTSNISSDHTWENWVPDPVCFDYVVETSLNNSSGTLVIEPGTVVGFEEGRGMRVLSSAGLVAEGTPAEPIVLTGTSPQRGFWNGVALEARDFQEHVVTHTTIEYAGGSSISQTQPANLMVTNDVTARLEHNTLREADGYGLFLGSVADVVGVGENVLTANALGSAYISATHAEHLKPGGDLLLGNDVDEVVVNPNRIDDETTWPRATYRILRTGGQSFNVFGFLTLVPGTELRVDGDQALLVWGGGGLSAVGTQADPILITATDPGSGNWRGLAFLGSDHPNNALEFVTMEYGGGGSIGTGATRANLILTFAGSGTIARVRIANSTFRHSAEYGIFAASASELVDFSGNRLTQNVLGAAAMDAPTVADILPGNDFTGNAVDEITVNVGTGLGLTEPTTWIDPGVPYFLRQSGSAAWVIPGQPFTLEPGVEMLFGPGVGLMLGTGSTFTAVGTADNRITLAAKSTPWMGLNFQGSLGILDFVDIANGGSGAWGTVGAPAQISLSLGFMSAGSAVTLGSGVGFSGGGFNLAFSYGNTMATCVGNVFIPFGDARSDHCF